MALFILYGATKRKATTRLLLYFNTAVMSNDVFLYKTNKSGMRNTLSQRTDLLIHGGLWSAREGKEGRSSGGKQDCDNGTMELMGKVK
jgi:hypothetical protein